MTHYIWTIVFIVFAYIYVSDENVQKYCDLIIQLIRINIIRFFFGIKLRTRLEWDHWQMKRAMKKILKERGLDKPSDIE